MLIYKGDMFFVVSMFLTSFFSLAMIFDGSAVEGTSIPKMGPYDIKIKFFEHCSTENSSSIEAEWKIQRINRSTMVAVVTVRNTIPIDDSITLEANFAVMTNQGWKDNFLISNFNDYGICELIKRAAPQQYEEIMANLDPPMTDCPIPPGTYKETLNIYLASIPSVPVFEYNQYRTRYRLFNDRKNELFCMYAYADVVPKRVKPKNSG